MTSPDTAARKPPRKLVPGLQPPWVVAHRGDSASAPENTEAAFRRAVDAGVEAIELDVQLTADGLPFVWHDRDAITRFEFCYGKSRDEHVLSWAEENGVGHARVDDGEHEPRRKQTPIVVPDGLFDPATIALEFERLGALIEPGVYRFVLSHIYRP